jgi:hypothetical protein
MSFCHKCGKEALPDASFCVACGVSLQDASAEPHPTSSSTVKNAANPTVIDIQQESPRDYRSSGEIAREKADAAGRPDDWEEFLPPLKKQPNAYVVTSSPKDKPEPIVSMKWNNGKLWRGLLFTMGPAILLAFIGAPELPKNQSIYLILVFSAIIGSVFIIGIPFLILARKFSFGRSLGTSWIICIVFALLFNKFSTLIDSLSPILRIIGSLAFAAVPSVIAMTLNPKLTDEKKREARLVSQVDKRSVIDSWKSKSDESLLEAASNFSEYTVEAETIIREEIKRRGLSIST